MSIRAARPVGPGARCTPPGSLGRSNATAPPLGCRRTSPRTTYAAYASLRIAEQRLSLQAIAEELRHSLEVLVDNYAHVISEYAGKGEIVPEMLIGEARDGRHPPTR